MGVPYCQAVTIAAETEQQRNKRHQQRTLFDRVAHLYDATRLCYPSDIVEFLFDTAELGQGTRVLEVGCGTGQLTQSLACYEFDLTAIDIGPAMIAAARRRLAGSAISFQVTSFEDFAAAAGSLDLIVSGTAFHWVDPEIKFHKSAELLRPGGWLALLATGERYDAPFGPALTDLWVARSDDNGAWLTKQKPADAEVIVGTSLFEYPIHRTSARRIVLPADAVIGVENTRAVSLSWSDKARLEFTDGLRDLLRSQTEVHLTQQTSLTMARVRA